MGLTHELFRSVNPGRAGFAPGCALDQHLRVPGEDPEDFRRHLAVYLSPFDARSRVIVETRAETWRDKIRLLAGLPSVRCDT